MYKILNIFFPSLIWHRYSKEKILYLTFDDGPHDHLTPFILKELKKYNAKATFFVIGKHVQKFADRFEDIIKDGHEIGNHTYHHKNGWLSTTKNYTEDIQKCNKLINSKLFRPPYGRINPFQIKRLKKNYRIVMWDVLSWDFKQNLSAKKCFKRVKRKIKNGSIIVFHENDKSLTNVKYCIPKLLKHFTDLGYQFKTISAH